MNLLIKDVKNSKRAIGVFVLLVMMITTTYAGVIYSDPMMAREVDMGNIITWSTASEQSSDHFAIFKSTNGVDFEQIGEEPAMGDSNTKKKYRFLDASTGNTKTFYRLMQVDLDGQQSYTHISVVQKENPNNFVVTMMGNTVTERYFNVVFRSEEAGQMTYRLVDRKEEVVKQGVISIDQGQNLFTLDLENAKSGRYNFEFNMKDEKESLILVKSNEDVMAIKK